MKKVTNKECIDAIEYFWCMDMLNNGMNTDERYYCKILIKKVSEILNLKLEDRKNEKPN